MKAVVAAFNQEKALVRDYESSDGPFGSTSRYADGGVVEWCAGLNCPQQGSTSDQTNVPEITLPPLFSAQSGLRTAFNICQIVDIAYLFWQSRILRQDVTSALLPFQLIFSHNFWIVRGCALQKQHICGILLCNLKF